LRRLAWSIVAVVVSFHALVASSLFALPWIDPPFTAVHVERRIEAWFDKKPYTKRYTPLPLSRVAPDLEHAVVAAEDSRFFQHHGFDLVEIQHAMDEEEDRGYPRGASTITPLAEWILGKRRILEPYLSVIEWGPGVYGAEAAARYHYSVPAARIGRDQAARLAAVIPSPRRRKPARMDRYSAVILERMRKMGW
jgi:monofunctional biosynthetic peptidoglycan transglycosylase